jgi:WD40 repeat protein
MTTQGTNWVGLVLGGNRYQVTARLGEGGMGLVYRARDCHLDCEVVIKVPRLTMLDNPEFAGRFAREVRSLVRLSHPHVVKVIDVGEHEGLPFAVMQYLSGGSLRDRPKESGGPLANLSGWLAEVAAALDFIHRQGYIHRDVKPDNILFDGHGMVYLSDFGIAKVLAHDDTASQNQVLTGDGMVLGTPRYMAPEMLLGEPIDRQIDQFALAATAYEILSGRTPYDGRSLVSILQQHLAGPPAALASLAPGVPPKVAAAIDKGLARSPGKRFASCRDFARAVLAGLGAGAEPSTAVENLPPPPTVVCPACGTTVTALVGGLERCPACGAPFAPTWSLPPVLEKATPTRPEDLSHRETPGMPELVRRMEGGPVNPERSRRTPGTPMRTTPEKYLAETLTRPVAVPSRRPRVIGCILVLPVLLFAGLGALGWWSGKFQGWIGPAAEDTRPLVAARTSPTTIRAETTDRAPHTTAPAVPLPTLRLTVPATVAVKAGESQVLEVQIVRTGCQGPVSVRLEGLPAGVTLVKPGVVAPDQDTVRLEMTAAPKAEEAETPVRVVADLGGVKAETSTRVSVTYPAGLIAVLNKHDDTVNSVAVTPDGKQVLSGDQDGVLYLWDPAPGGKTRRLRGHNGSIYQVAISPDGRWGLSGGADKMLRLWDLHGGDDEKDSFASRAVVTGVGFSADSRRGLAAGVSVRQWDLDSHKELVSFPYPEKFPWVAAYSPDGRHAMAGGTDGSLYLWDTTTGNAVRRYEGHTNTVLSVTFSADGRRVLSSSADNTLRLWEVHTGQLLRRFDQQAIHQAALSPDGRRVLSADADHALVLLDADTGQVLQRFPGHTAAVESVAIAANGRRAVSGGADQTVRVWRLPK